MRCTSCGYSLWNQPAPTDGSPRRCPECGVEYALDQFSFAHGKVEFSCPACSQTYFGTDEQGHLDPREFYCVTCGVPLTMNSCTARPFGDVPEAQAMRVEPLPWIGGVGSVFGRWMRTIGACVSDPGSIPARIEGLGDSGAAARFLVLQIAVISGVSLLYAAVTVVFMIGVMGGAGGGAGPGGFAPIAVAPGIGMMMAASAAGVALHALLLLGGIVGAAGFVALVAGRERVGFTRMFAVLAFASSVMIFSLVPICGGLLAPILWIVQSAQAVAAAMPQDRKAVAVIVTVVILVFSWLLQCGAGAISGLLF